VERGVKRPRARLLVAAAAVLAGLGAAEVALHQAPSLLPGWYLQLFPGNGTEFFHPDVFARTPVEGVLLPHRARTHRGPPPADLVEMGVAPRGVDDDERAFPEILLPVDELGFPNERLSAQADVVIVGDSFGVSAGALRPAGLQALLARATGLSVLNLSLAATGPVHERWLLETCGLPRRPRAVLWLYFSGNDLTTSYEPFLQRRDGHATWADAAPERRKPRLYLWDLLWRWSRPAAGPRCPAPLPGFARTGSAGRLWFHPDYLRQLGWSADEWRAHPVWGAVQGELRAARDACARAEAELVLLYLPSKEEVHLPHVERDPALVLRTLMALGEPPPAGTPEEVLERLLANRGAQESVVAEFCARESIAFLSATPWLEALARRGALGYLVTDTHWTPVGQAERLAPLVELLRARGVAR
jgi:hypothetical protein